MKKTYFLTALIAVFALVSCGGGAKKDNKDDEKAVCGGKNAIAITIQDYHYGMSDTLVFATSDFVIKNSDFKWLNDSTVSLKLSNYEQKELVGERAEDQIDLNIELRARKGKKLSPGYYGYMDYESGMSSSVTMTTAYGTVYFNWFSGMPDQGGVTVEHVSKDAVCGTLALNVEKPDSPTIGIVRVNGTFVYKK